MTAGIATRTRGTVIKTPDATPGLLIADGRQMSFTLEGIWRSPVAPSINMAVDVDLDANGAVVALTAIDPQQAARERLNQIGDVAQQQGRVAADMARHGVGALAGRMGTPVLAAAVALALAWFLLPAINVEFFLVSRSFTFWELLGLSGANLANGAVADHGVFSLLGLAALAGPFVAPFLRHPRARLLNAAPLAFLVLTLLKVAYEIRRAVNAFSGFGGGENGGLFGEAAQSAASIVSEAISVGFGAYVLLGAAALLAFRGARRS